MTLVLIRQGDKILLGMKKRGFGVGRYNGFGGKIKNNENIIEAAKRETLEECNLKINNLEKIATMNFFWKNNDNHCEVHLFKATELSGELKESEEMKPEWFNIDNLPLDKMWADDKYWMPLFLANKKFTGKFIFDKNDKVLKYSLNEK